MAEPIEIDVWQGDIAELEVDAHLGHQVRLGEARAGHLVEPLGEARHVRGVDRHSGGGLVPAEPLEEVAALA